MNLLDLADLVAWLKPGSALHRAQDPDEWMWGLPEMLAAEVVDTIRHFEWQSARLTEGVKGVPSNPPDPLPRPGITPKGGELVGGGKAESLPIDEMAAWLGGEFAALNN